MNITTADAVVLQVALQLKPCHKTWQCIRIIENTFKKYRYSVNIFDIGIKKVSQSIKKPRKQRIYAIFGVRFTTQTLSSPAAYWSDHTLPC